MDTDTNTTSATVAQLVEQGSRKATVAGSMPVGGSNFTGASDGPVSLQFEQLNEQD